MMVWWFIAFIILLCLCTRFSVKLVNCNSSVKLYFMFDAIYVHFPHRMIVNLFNKGNKGPSYFAFDILSYSRIDRLYVAKYSTYPYDRPIGDTMFIIGGYVLAGVLHYVSKSIDLVEVTLRDINSSRRNEVYFEGHIYGVGILMASLRYILRRFLWVR